MKYVYQAPLTVGSIHNTVTFAKLGLKAIGNERLHAIEIGNEPNLAGFKSPQAYVDKWLQYAEAVSGNLTTLPSGPVYQGLALASGATPPFNVLVFYFSKSNSA